MSQGYFPVAIIDNKNKLQLIKYNKGIERNDEVTTETAPGKADFQVVNLKGLLDEIALSESILQILNTHSNSNANIDISILDYDGSSLKVEFRFSGSTISQFIAALFESPMMQDISENGVSDWIPLDTQSLVLLYPDYEKETPSELITNEDLNKPTFDSSECIFSSSISSSLNGFDWRYAHFEETFRSFASKDKSKFNIRREGVIVVSVIREWLVTEKLQSFMQNLLLFTNIVSSSGHSQTKLVFWVLARFKQIVDGFQNANQLYGRLAQYRMHFQNVFADHCTQMEAHLKALQDNISAILEDNNPSDIESRIINLAEILVVSTKTMLAFTVALQTRLKELGSLRESTHRKLLANVVMAAAGLGMAFYTRSSSKFTARAAQLTTVAGGCTLVYYYHQFNKELDELVSDQSSIIDQAAELTFALQRHTNLWAQHAASTTDSSTLPILYSHLSLLQNDLQQLRGAFTISPNPTNTASITWW